MINTTRITWTNMSRTKWGLRFPRSWLRYSWCPLTKVMFFQKRLEKTSLQYHQIWGSEASLMKHNKLRTKSICEMCLLKPVSVIFRCLTLVCFYCTTTHIVTEMSNQHHSLGFLLSSNCTCKMERKITDSPDPQFRKHKEPILMTSEGKS